MPFDRRRDHIQRRRERDSLKNSMLGEKYARQGSAPPFCVLRPKQTYFTGGRSKFEVEISMFRKFAANIATIIVFLVTFHSFRSLI